MNIDFETFKNDITWFIKPTDKVELLEITLNYSLTEKFQETFPKLTSLIEKSRVLNLIINYQSYRLFSWTNKDNMSFGWLNKIESDKTTDIELIDEHELLLLEIGGIQESYCKLPHNWAILKEKISKFKMENDEKNTIHRTSDYLDVKTA